jgi:hypothetical protein
MKLEYLSFSALYEYNDQFHTLATLPPTPPPKTNTHRLPLGGPQNQGGHNEDKDSVLAKNYRRVAQPS